MLKLRDFQHLPQVVTLVEQMVTDGAGMVVVAGPDPRPFSSVATGDVLLPSGRSAFMDILIHEILEAQPDKNCVVVSRDKLFARPARALKKRTRLLKVEAPFTYRDRIEEAASLLPGLLVVDRLCAESLIPAFQAVESGLKVIAQLDTILRGENLKRQLQDMGAPPSLLPKLTWVFAVQRLPALCNHCKQPLASVEEPFALLRSRLPHLEVCLQEFDPARNHGIRFFQPGACSICRQSGRYGDIAAFDVFKSAGEQDPSLQPEGRLTLEEYMLRLAALGHLALHDLLGLENDQLRRTYNLLTASEQALTGANASLNHKLAELEAANRVLVKRTEVLVSLQDLSHSLISSVDLTGLARKITYSTLQLCGADRAVLYYLRPSGDINEQVEIIATSGWEVEMTGLQTGAASVLENVENPRPQPFKDLPPGLSAALLDKNSDPQKKPLLCGLRVPLIVQGEAIGALIVHSTQKIRFTQGEAALLQTLADQAALTLQRAGLIERLRGKIVELEEAQAELVKKERLEKELELARQVQQSVLPRSFPPFPGYSFAAKNEPARQVGGDFYDVITLDDDHVGLAIGDVSDKGMPAALYMALTRSLLLAESRRERSPRAVLNAVNRLLQELGEPARFVSVFYAVVEQATGCMTYARAGHDHPVILRNGEIQRLGGTGAVLGVLEESELDLSEEKFDLLPGDRLVLYTDGLTDVIGPRGQLFDRDRLEELLLSQSALPLHQLCEETFTRLAAFQGESEQFDDMTLVVMEVDERTGIYPDR